MDYRSHFIEHGYVLLPGAMKPILPQLREATDILHKEVAEGRLKGCRHQTVLKPDVFHHAYVDFLNLPAMNEAAFEILGSRDILISGLACLLGNPKHQFCGWHRDFPDEEDAEVLELLSVPDCGLQLNCAIYPDHSLWIIPGSHTRKSTDTELAYKAKFKDTKFIDEWDVFLDCDAGIPGSMPGSMQVKLEAGDCLLYNFMLWHAAEYRPEWKRATLHGGFKSSAMVDRFVNMRWGFEHNPWLQEPDYLGNLGEYLPQLLKNYQVKVQQYPEGAKKTY